MLTLEEVIYIRKQDFILKDYDTNDDHQWVAHFNNHLSGFCIVELLNEMIEIAVQFEISWLNIELVYHSKYNSRGKYFFYTSFLGRDVNGDEIKIVRNFLMQQGKKRVYHHLFLIPIKLQGQDLAKLILKAFYTQYNNAGINNIDVFANIDIGGYAWARYGFTATIRTEVKKIYKKAFRLANRPQSGITREDAAVVKAIVEDYYQNNPSGKAFMMNDLADLSFGKTLLMKTKWHGTIDLQNSEQVAIFKRYILLN